MSLKNKLGSFKSEKNKLNGMATQIKVQSTQTEKTIKEEFQKLYCFLRAEETARIDAVRKEGAQKSKSIQDNIAKLESDISALMQKITNVEKEMRAKGFPFMQKVKDTIKLSQCDLTKPETPRDALINEAKHIGNLLITVWTKMENFMEYVRVTLGPNTGSKLMTISDIIEGQLTENRLSRNEVLVPEGLKSGKHFWDVALEGYWALGVAEESNKCSTNRNVWGIHRRYHHEWMYELTPEQGEGGGNALEEKSCPKRVRVMLDYNQGTVSFFDLDQKTVVHTIKHTFRNTVFPYFKDRNPFFF